MSKIIKIENLTFQYREDEEEKLDIRPAIEDLSLTIDGGTFVAIIGKNGSGKSTLAKNLNGLLLPSGGAVYVEGMDTADEDSIWKIRQQAGMVFQNPDNQLVSSIVEDDVAFGLENLGVEPLEIRKRVDEALEWVGMSDFKRKSPHLLSGGQKQRVAIAGVVAMKPKCIIFDEPTAMLDPKGRKDVMDIVHRLHREGITVVLITHFMEEAVLADRIVIMDDGKVLLDGSPDEVFSEEERLREASLDVPMVVEICHYLRRRGIDVPSNIIKVEELVDFICQYK